MALPPRTGPDTCFDFSQLHLCLNGNKDTDSYKAFKCCFLIGWRVALLQHSHVSRAEVESRNQRILVFSGVFYINSSSALGKLKGSPTVEKKILKSIKHMS